MTLSHHPPGEMLLAYAAGVLDAEDELIVACHATWCPACRSSVGEGEAATAALALRGADDTFDVEAALSKLLTRLDEPVTAPEPLPAVETAVPWPAPLRRRVNRFEDLQFRTTWPGMRVARVPSSGTRRVFIADFAPGFVVPSHQHTGLERVLVMRGGFSHAGMAYGPGDLAFEEDDHADVRIDDDGPCTSLFVNDGPLLVGPVWLHATLDRWMMRG